MQLNPRWFDLQLEFHNKFCQKTRFHNWDPCLFQTKDQLLQLVFMFQYQRELYAIQGGKFSRFSCVLRVSGNGTEQA